MSKEYFDVLDENGHKTGNNEVITMEMENKNGFKRI